MRQEDRPAKRRAVVILDSRAGGHAGSGRSSSLEWCVTTAASVTAHVGAAGMPCTSSPRTRAPTPARTTTSPTTPALDTLARVTAGPDDGLRSVLHAASAVTSQGGLVVFVGGPLATTTPAPSPRCASPARPGSRWSIDPSSFAGRVGSASAAPGLRGDDRHAAGVRVDGHRRRLADGPAAAWSAVVGAARWVPDEPLPPGRGLARRPRVMAVALPLTTLFAPTSAWFRPSLLLVALVALGGMGRGASRRHARSSSSGQVVLLLQGAAVLHGQGHLW